ncbi:Uncharacterised protein [Mycobacterium tuberculosis]|nr:Uncharacterised protein [Mycobacterium tuberculosis]
MDWRNANRPSLHSRDRKAWDARRLRFFNVYVSILNKVLAADMAV